MTQKTDLGTTREVIENAGLTPHPIDVGKTYLRGDRRVIIAWFRHDAVTEELKQKVKDSLIEEFGDRYIDSNLSSVPRGVLAEVHLKY